MKSAQHRPSPGISFLLLGTLLLAGCLKEGGGAGAERTVPPVRQKAASASAPRTPPVDEMRAGLDRLSGSSLERLAGTKSFLAEARASGASDREITDFVFREYSQKDPATALVILGQVAERDEFASLQREIVGRVATEDVSRALDLVKIHPAGERFQSGLAALLGAIPLTADRLKDFTRVRQAFDDPEDLEAYDKVFAQALLSKAPDSSVLKAVAGDPGAGALASSRAELMLWEGSGKSAADLATLRDQADGLSREAAYRVVEDLFKPGTSPEELLKLSAGDASLSAAAVSRLVKDHGNNPAVLEQIASALSSETTAGAGNVPLSLLAAKTGELSPVDRDAVLARLPSDALRDQARSEIALRLARRGDGTLAAVIAAIQDPQVRQRAAEACQPSNFHE
jgi:hypothetical protein